MKKNILYCSALASLPTLFGAASATSTPQVQPSGVSEIVVTAQKREQRLQDVPASVSALTAQKLTISRVQNVTDLDALTPNLTVTFTPSGSSAPVYSMRGVIASATAPGADKGVAVYIDGVYLGTGSGSVFDLADVERVEVLKGPQGTLFGRNSTGGAISFTTRGPTGHFGFKQEFTGGNYDQFRSRTRLDLPQMGPLSAAVTYTHSQRRGDIQNLGAGTTWDYSQVGGPAQVTSPKWLGDYTTNAWAASAKFAPTANFDIVYKFDYTDSTFSEVGVGLMQYPTPLLGLFHVTNPSPTPASLVRPSAVNNWLDTMSKVRAQGHSLTASWRIDEHVSLKNIIGYRSGVYSAPGDQLDGWGGLMSVAGGPFIGIGPHSAGHDNELSEELQADFDAHDFHLTTGGLLYHYFVEKGQYGSAFNTDTFKRVPGFVIPSQGTTQQSYANTDSQAVYAQGEFHVLPELDAVLGGRYTHDKKYGADWTVHSLGVLPIAYHDGEWTYATGLNYKPTKDILAYIKYSTGYVSGGHLATLDFRAEHAGSWEGGLKTEWFDRRLIADLAVFSAHYTDLQISGSGTTYGVPQASQVLVNAGDANAKGFELDLTAAPIEGLTLGLDLGYLDFKYTKLDPRFYNAGNKVVAQRPPWTANLSTQYVTQPLFDEGRLSVAVDANFKAAHNGSANPDVRAYTFIPDVWLVNARIALQEFKVGSNKATVALWSKNLLDNKALEYPVALGPVAGTFIISGSYQAARTFGVDVTFQY